MIHTCGPYDDRFDLVLKESGDAWHISDTQTKKVKDEYGDQVSLMGNIPCVSVLMEGTPEEVYKYAYQECMDGARDGRFILSGDCDVSPMTPDENVIEAVRCRKGSVWKEVKRGKIRWARSKILTVPMTIQPGSMAK